MMVPHYTLAELVYCLGSGSDRQAFGVALVEQKVMVVVEQVMEAKEREDSCIGASIPKRFIPLRLRLSIGLK